MDEVRSPLLLQRRESRDRCADLKYLFLTARWAPPTLVSLARSPRERLVATGADMLSSDQATQAGGGLAMAKVLRCGDLMPGCNAVIEGKDEAEVMTKGAEHAKTVHKMTAIPPDMAAKVKAAIKDKK